MKLLLYSELDPAGVNIASYLMLEIPFRETYLGKIKALFYEDIYLISTKEQLVNININFPDVSYAIFLSKHKSESGLVCLTTHTPGNLCNKAELGGNPKEVAISNPPIIRAILKNLHKFVKEYEINIPVTIEATHHGPTNLNFPVTFVEIGSNELAWKNNKFGEIVAKSILYSINSSIEIQSGGLGIGGGHYSEKFTNKILNENILIGHIIPKYAMIEGMETSMIELCIKRTLGGCSKVYIDWKGTPSIYKEYLKSMKNIEIIRI
ncbi:MAG: D-aminoacyl-tRNA deacylase [Candidatus Methanomethyliaceae archaeon]